MKILALDSSGLVASVAVVQDANLIAEFTINYKKTHSQTLLPMLDTVKEMIELDLNTLDAIAVAAGPGSFTGLRIGSATAKGLGLALKVPIIGVPTVDGLAYNLYGTDKLVCPIMDARRNQVYTGIYRFVLAENADEADVDMGQSYRMETVVPQCAVSIDEIAEKWNLLGKEIILLGDGVPVFSKRLRELVQVPYSYAPAHLNKQRGAAIGTLACLYYKRGDFQSAAEHQPEYLRLSQAERERMEKEQC